MAKIWTDEKIRETVKYTLEVEQGLKIEEIPRVISKIYLINIGLKSQLGKFKDSPANLIKFVYPNTFSDKDFNVRGSKNSIPNNYSEGMGHSILRVVNSKEFKNKELITSIINKAIDIELENNTELLNKLQLLLDKKDELTLISNQELKELRELKESSNKTNTNNTTVNTTKYKEKKKLKNEIRKIEKTLKKEELIKKVERNINNLNLPNKDNKLDNNKNLQSKVNIETNKETKEIVKRNPNIHNKVVSIDQLIDNTTYNVYRKPDILKYIELEDRKFYKLSDFEWYDRVEENYKNDFIWLKARTNLKVEKVQIKTINEHKHKVKMIINSNYILNNTKIVLFLNLKYNTKDKVWISEYKEVKFLDLTKDEKFNNIELKEKLKSLCPPLSIHGDFEKIITNALESVSTYKGSKVIQVRKYIFN